MAHRNLSKEEAAQVLAEARSRGDYLVQLQKFVESGELGWDFAEIFTGKDPKTIRTSVNNNIEKHSTQLNWPKFRVMVDETQCIVVNMDEFDKAVASNGTT